MSHFPVVPGLNSVAVSPFIARTTHHNMLDDLIFGKKSFLQINGSAQEAFRYKVPRTTRLVPYDSIRPFLTNINPHVR